MATGQKNLARTLIDILGEDQVIELMGVDRLVAALDKEQRLKFLRTLMSGLSKQELKNLLVDHNNKSADTNDKKKVPSPDDTD